MPITIGILKDWKKPHHNEVSPTDSFKDANARAPEAGDEALAKTAQTTETRVAISDVALKKLKKLGCQIQVESHAGVLAGFTNDILLSHGATIVERSGALACDVVFSLLPPQPEDLTSLKASAIWISQLSPLTHRDIINKLNQTQVTAFSVELLPRTSRAQSMDVLSSQANIAGYKAVLEACRYYPRFLPMMMTSAGLAKPAKVLVLGAGVAGLQAIATAKRLGASVEAFDPRTEVKEQIESLGAKFLELGIKSETIAGYAKSLSDEDKKKQQNALTECIKKFDIVISTASVQGKPSPTLITRNAVAGMRLGSVIVDLAAMGGGNCELTQKDKIIEFSGVTIVGHTKLASQLPYDASLFYSQNLAALVALVIKEDRIHVSFDDDIIDAVCVCHLGKLRGALNG